MSTLQLSRGLKCRAPASTRQRNVSARAMLDGKQALRTAIAGASAVTLLLGTAGTSLAAREKVGEFAASGFLFKDNVEVTALDDPEVPGVTLYISDFKRSLADKLAKDFFTEPSQASITCVANPSVTAPDASRLGGTEGKEVFAERKGLSLFKDKTLRVRRIYDDERRALVYVAYRTSLTSASDEGGVSAGRYRTSVCAVSIPAPAPAVVPAAPLVPVAAE